MAAKTTSTFALIATAVFLITVAPASQAEDSMPPDQVAFLAAANDARGMIEKAANDLAAGAARRNRMKAMCSAVKGSKVENWMGTIHSLSTNGDGLGVLEIDLGEDVYVKTWNNALSDVSDKTMIDPSSGLFEKLVVMTEGQKVRFSAQLIKTPKGPDCFRESSLTLSGSMEEPEFIARFTDISAAD